MPEILLPNWSVTLAIKFCGNWKFIVACCPFPCWEMIMLAGPGETVKVKVAVGPVMINLAVTVKEPVI